MTERVIVVKHNERNDFEEICNLRVLQGYKIVAAGYTPSYIDPKRSTCNSYHYAASFWWAIMEVAE